MTIARAQVILHKYWSSKDAVYKTITRADLLQLADLAGKSTNYSPSVTTFGQELHRKFTDACDPEMIHEMCFIVLSCKP